MRFRSPALLFCALGVLGACALIPMSDPEEGRNPQDPQFDADYYAQNAKEYFEGDQFARAREQWEQQLKLQPGDWMAQVGIASCDWHLGSMALDRGDLRTAENRISNAHKAATALWNGSVEADTVKASNIPIAQWKAALVVALSTRGLADCHTVVGRLEAQRLSALSPHDAARERLEQAIAKNRAEAAQHNATALALFRRLDAMENPAPEATLNVAELQVSTGDATAAEQTFRRWLGTSTQSLSFWQQQLDACAQEADARRAEARRGIINGKLKSVSAKRAAVLVRLGNMAFDQGETLLSSGSAPREQLEREAKRHFSHAVDDLNLALAAEPSRTDVLMKLAQCQGRLGQYELASGNIERYIRVRSEHADSFDADLSMAFRLRAEFAARLKPR